MMSPDMPHMTKEEKAERERYEAEDDLRTLVRANEIMGDKARLKRARAMAKEQMTALGKVNNG